MDLLTSSVLQSNAEETELLSNKGKNRLTMQFSHVYKKYNT